MLKINEKLITSDNYSTSEKVIGRWINGKPIYRKSFYYTNAIGNNGEAVIGTISNIDLIIKVDCMSKGGNNWFPLPLSNPGSLNYQIEMWVENGSVKIHNGSSRSTTIAIAHVEYTKTTD